MDYKIIKLYPENYFKCANIWDMDRDPNRTSKYYNELISGSRETFVYEKEGEYLGEGSIVFANNDPDYTIPGKRVYLSRMIIKKEYRNKGIGSIIIDYLLDYAKAQGFKEISVGVDIDNTVAWHLYEKKGFNNVIFEGEDDAGKYVKLLKEL